MSLSCGTRTRIVSLGPGSWRWFAPLAGLVAAGAAPRRRRTPKPPSPPPRTRIGPTPSSAATRSMTWPWRGSKPRAPGRTCSASTAWPTRCACPGRQAAHASGLAQARGGGGRRDVRQGRCHAAARAEPGAAAGPARSCAAAMLCNRRAGSVSVRFADGSRPLVPPGSEVQLESLLVLGLPRCRPWCVARAAGWGREPGRAQPAAPAQVRGADPVKLNPARHRVPRPGGRRSPVVAVDAGRACHRRGVLTSCPARACGRRRRPAVRGCCPRPTWAAVPRVVERLPLRSVGRPAPTAPGAPRSCAAGLQSPAARCASQAARSHLAPRPGPRLMATTRCACALIDAAGLEARPPMWISAAGAARAALHPPAGA